MTLEQALQRIEELENYIQENRDIVETISTINSEYVERFKDYDAKIKSWNKTLTDLQIDILNTF